jgi:hypothetical protein
MQSFKAGNLVTITRSSIGIKKGAIGLIVKHHVLVPLAHPSKIDFIWEVMLCASDSIDPLLRGSIRRYLQQDLVRL